MSEIHEYENKKHNVLFFISLVFFFTPFIILCLYNHPSMDDYILGYHARTEGFWTYQQNIYIHWGGRFASTFLACLFALYNFVFHYYYLPTIALLLLTYVSIGILFSSVNFYWLKNYYARAQILLASGIYLVLLCCCYAEVSTAYYWFSSAITYQVPTALFHAALAFGIRTTYATTTWKKSMYFFLTSTCITAINGANEMIALIMGTVFIILGGLLLTIFPQQKKIFYLYGIIYLASFTVLAVSPGARERSAGIDNAGLLKSFLFSGARTVYTFYHICKEPLFWLCGIWLFIQCQIIGKKQQPIQSVAFYHLLHRNKKWLLPLIVVLITLIYLPLMYISNGSLPERATNNMIFFTVFLLMSCFLIFGITTKIGTVPDSIQKIIRAGICVTLVFNTAYFTSLQNIIAGFFYDKVITARENTLTAASKNHVKTALINNYDSALQHEIRTRFHEKPRRQLEIIINKKPEYIYVFDDLSTSDNINTLRQYFNIATIIVSSNKARNKY